MVKFGVRQILVGALCVMAGSIGLSLAAHNSLCTGHILAFGNDEQKNKKKTACAFHLFFLKDKLD